jgi:isopentenyl diphosphate isomerase/L-lactate dehydrogenase-like FMN-dependent dehydrogenase
MSDHPSAARARQEAIYVGGASGATPTVPVAPDELRRAARRKVSRRAYAYVAGGAGEERTMAANRSAFDRWRVVPRVLRDVGSRDTRVQLFGRELPAPVLLAPIGVLELMHDDADVAVAEAAAGEGVPVVFSNQASRALEECVAVMGDAPRWFQLYWSRSTDLVLSFVERAERAGCDALVVTLDTTLLGWRPRDLDLAYLPFLRGRGLAQYTSDPVFRRQVAERAETYERRSTRVTPSAVRTLLQLARSHPGSVVDNVRSTTPLAAVERFIQTYSKPSLDWDDIALLRARTDLPIVLKGVLHPDDARRAVDTGVDGVIVSNHGGRQVDGAIAALDALPGVVDAVGDHTAVLMDSGVRGGAHVFTALALGARAVLVGRPYAYGLAVGGADGVREVIRNIVAEFELTMALVGCRAVDEIGADHLVPAGDRPAIG